ncbi:glycosyltransferase family 4 protein [Alicyclobacillus curvatus]|nr:glycosyltransferase family 4 protein [Alicyclobacillus curvatus]
MNDDVTIFCESANGRTGIPRYIQSLSKYLTDKSDHDDLRIRFTARWLHHIPQLDDIGVPYQTSKLPGRVQHFLRRRGIGDRTLYGCGPVVHELNYMFTQVPKRTRIIMSVHDVGWRHSTVGYGLSDDFVRQAERGIARAHRLITSTESVKADLVRLLNVPVDKIVVIPPGISETFLVRHDEVSVPSLPSKYWLFVGAVTPRKNLDIVLKTLSQMENRIPLVIAGPYIHYLDVVVQKAKDLRVPVIHIDGSSDEELVQIYQRATGLVYPSLWEGFGFPLVEAAACGIPVITSNNTSMKEVGAGYAWLVNPTDLQELMAAMNRVLLLSDEERAALQIRGRALARKYSWEQTAQRHMELYREELSKVCL